MFLLRICARYISLFFFKQKTAYELRISDWSSDVCSSDLTKLKTWVRRYFRDEIAPIITPIGLDPTHPFPLLVNKSLNFIVELEGIVAFGREIGRASWRERVCQ